MSIISEINYHGFVLLMRSQKTKLTLRQVACIAHHRLHRLHRS